MCLSLTDFCEVVKRCNDDLVSCLKIVKKEKSSVSVPQSYLMGFFLQVTQVIHSSVFLLRGLQSLELEQSDKSREGRERELGRDGDRTMASER